MKTIPHWTGSGELVVAESKSGVLVTQHPFDNLVRGAVTPWPPPEIVQKLYSGRWRGATRADDRAATKALEHYCALQSLNSEDAITWSFFGPLSYASDEERRQFASKLLARLGESVPPGPATVWLWRRVPHPEKTASTGGPEIDFGVQMGATVVLGEAKWNSSLGRGQGVGKDKTQLDLRQAYCAGLGLRALSDVNRWIILGVSRTADPLLSGDQRDKRIGVSNITWRELAELYPPQKRDELLAYLQWKERYSSVIPKRSHNSARA